MPETGFSLQRITAHLRKWIGLYIAGTIAVCFLNHLVYTITRPGFSDDERLKVMLLNVESILPDAEYAELSMQLLPALQQVDEGILILEFESLPPVSADDAASEMLLSVKLTGGYGDLYLTDEAGLALLKRKQACVEEAVIHLESCRLTGGECYLAVISNTTDMESAMRALSVLAKELKG